MGTLEVNNELTFKCEACGADMEVSFNYRDKTVVEVEPCEYCLDEKYDQGLKDGKEEGSDDE